LKMKVAHYRGFVQNRYCRGDVKERERQRL
jgi:hypothetical protein